ncbi:MAG: efflux RND transporter periplasmic adaptor subunit [Acidobacteriota bacterium]
MKTQISLICMCLLLSACHAKEEEPAVKPVVEVVTAKAEIAEMTTAVQGPATIFPREQAGLGARITARILKLSAKKGDYVAAGQLLAQLEDRDLVAQRDEAKAALLNAEASLERIKSGTLPTELERVRGQVAMAKASLDQAQKNYDRRRELFEKGGIPQRELLLAETELALARTSYDVAVKSQDLFENRARTLDVQMAQSTVEQARARLAQAVAQLAFAVIRSPFAGVITDQLMFAGDLARPDAPVFTVMDLSVAVARAQLPQAQGAGVRAGQSCTFTPADASDVTFSGRTTVINQAVDPQRRTFEVWCEIPNAQRRIKGGVFGTVSIAIGAPVQGVVVPVAAVQFAEEGGKGTVMIVDAKQIAHSHEVETGEVVDGKVRIIAGLEGGETVIVEGGYSLPDGTEVRSKEDKEKDDKEKEKDDKGEKGKEEKAK